MGTGGDGNTLGTYDPQKRSSIIKGWWEKKAAYFGETVRFDIVTDNIPDGDTIRVQIWDYLAGPDRDVSDVFDVKITGNKGYFDLYIKKEWIELLHTWEVVFEGDDVEFYVQASYKGGSTVDLADTDKERLIVKIKRTIYLTFDDGLQLGTEEVLKVLDDTGVKATFFLTGLHIKSFMKHYPDKWKGILEKIYTKHAIGNHSYTHANDFYGAYYRNGGVLIGNDGERRTVFDDFKKCEELVTDLIKQIDKSYAKTHMQAKNQKYGLVRFPGTDTWKTNTFTDIKNTNRGKLGNGQEDTKEEAEELFNYGYRIFGWDEEWNMEQQMTKKVLKAHQKAIPENEKDYTNEEQNRPFFDLNSEEYVKNDRVNETWKTVKNEVLAYSFKPPKNKPEGSCVLLMHERSFRGGKGYENASENLKKFIEYFKGIDAKFDTLDNYD